MTRSLLALLLLAAPLAAQTPIPGPVPHRLLITPRAESQVPVARVAEIRASRAPRTLGIIGAVLGAAGGTFVGAAGCSFSDDDQRDCTAKMPLYGLSGALLTGGLFWLIGKAVS
jgi:hypothetical protein